MREVVEAVFELLLLFLAKTFSKVFKGDDIGLEATIFAIVILVTLIICYVAFASYRRSKKNDGHDG